MGGRRILGLIVLIGGVVLLFISNYIKGQVAGGEEQISSAQKKVKQADSLFSLNPVAKDIGGSLTKGAQKKIDTAKDKVAYYAELARQLQVAGFIVIALGVIIILIPSRKKRS
jgi:hypothetical protein